MTANEHKSLGRTLSLVYRLESSFSNLTMMATVLVAYVWLFLVAIAVVEAVLGRG